MKTKERPSVNQHSRRHSGFGLFIAVAGAVLSSSPALYAPILPPVPVLAAGRSGNNVTVSWPAWAATNGFVLIQNTNLSTGNWVASRLPMATNGSTVSATTHSPTGHLYFRLVR
jgi:hypothetical protein